MSYFIKIFWIIWNFWFKLPDKIRFLLVGGFNALVQYLIYISFLYFWSEDKYQTALILSWIISSFSSFATQKIFLSDHSPKQQKNVRCKVERLNFLKENVR